MLRGFPSQRDGMQLRSNPVVVVPRLIKNNTRDSMSSKLVSWIHKPVAIGGKGVDWDDVSTLTSPTVSKPSSGSLAGASTSLAGAAFIGSALGNTEDSIDLPPKMPSVAKTPANSPVQTCRPLSCYESCKLKDKKKLQQCRALNAKFTEEMKKLGCLGTKCCTPTFKSCR